MPVKTKVDLVARAIKPKTYVSQDGGPRLQKRPAAGFDLKATSLVAAVRRHPNFCVVKSVFVCEFIWLSSITILSPGNGWTLVRPPLAAPGQAGPGRAAAGPGQAARLLQVKNPALQRILGNVTPRSGWQRCLSNYRVSLFCGCSLIVVHVLRLQCFQHFLFVFCVF